MDFDNRWVRPADLARCAGVPLTSLRNLKSLCRQPLARARTRLTSSEGGKHEWLWEAGEAVEFLDRVLHSGLSDHAVEMIAASSFHIIPSEFQRN